MESTKGETMKYEAELFGSITRLPVIGNLPVPAAELLEKLPDEDYETHLFCSGCGTVLPILKDSIIKIVGSELESYDKKYILVERCSACNDEFVSPEFRDIPEN